MSKEKNSRSEFLFAERLQALRDREGLKQKDLAQRLGVTPVYISELISGKKSNPSASLIQRICSEFAVEPDWLLGAEVPSSPTAEEQLAAGPAGAASAMADAELEEMVDEWWASLKGDDNPRKRAAKAETIQALLDEIRRRACGALPRVVSAKELRRRSEAGPSGDRS